jgi:hypothetical protein
VFLYPGAWALTGATAAGCNSARGADRAPKTTADSARADSIARARQDSINRAQPGYVIDSILPVEEELRRFRAKVGATPATTLQHGSPTRNALVARVVDDVARRDSVDLAEAALTPREFVDLYYPSSPYARPPYSQAPGLVWMGIANHSTTGFTRLVRRRGGAGLKLAGYSCGEKPEIQGENRLWSNCVLRLTDPSGRAGTERWFGTIVERDGKFKLLGFANQF